MYPDDNPKTAAGAEKAPFHNIPLSVLAELGWRMKHGADKYGPFNWRAYPISCSVYISAIMRHLIQFMEGEWVDGDCEYGTSHLSAIMACCMLLIDSHNMDILNDDRPLCQDLGVIERWISPSS
jgi:hypothetical protein